VKGKTEINRRVDPPPDLGVDRDESAALPGVTAELVSHFSSGCP
jgi:hypothetical protein